MLSRLAGDCFWLARYLERAENTARLVSAANLLALTPEAGADRERAWLAALRIGSGTPVDEATRDGVVVAKAAIAHLVVDRDQPSSILGSLRSVRENARAARHLLTADLWEAINGTWLEARDLDEGTISRRGLDDCLGWVRRQCQLIRGAAEDVPGRELHHILDFGQAVERIDYTSRLLAVELPDLAADPEPAIGSPAFRRWEALLSAAASIEAYRRMAHHGIAAATVMELLVHDADSPRSLVVCADRLQRSLRGLSGRDRGPAHDATAAVAAQAAALADLDLASPAGQAALAELIVRTNAAAAATQQHHFSGMNPSIAPVRSLGSGVWSPDILMVQAQDGQTQSQGPVLSSTPDSRPQTPDRGNPISTPDPRPQTPDRGNERGNPP